MDLPHTIEAILFATAEPMTYKELATITGTPTEEVRRAADALSVMLRGRGIVLLKTDSRIELRTHPDAQGEVEKALEESFTATIGPAGAEVLSIVLYHGPATRSEIEHMRGVNSGSTLRLLSMRGLIRRGGEGPASPPGREGRAYEATEELLAHLGVEEVRQLPSYQETRERLSALVDAHKEENHVQ